MYYNVGIVAVNSEVVGLVPGANPTIGSYNASAVKIYNASAVKIYNAASSLVRFENKKLLVKKAPSKLRSRRIDYWSQPYKTPAL
jgi:hypothetical protein